MWAVTFAVFINPFSSRAQHSMKSDSFKKRYLYKLSTNFLGFFISLFTAGIVPRALGVENYGVFNYITTFFRQILDFLDARTSTCFYVNLSQKPDDSDLLSFYSYYIIGVVIVLFGMSSVLAFTPIGALIQIPKWPALFFYAAAFCVFTWISEILISVMDAHGYTVPLEKIRLINRVISTIVLLFLFSQKMLNIRNYFYYQFLILLLLSVFILIFLWRQNRSGIEINKISISAFKNKGRAFFQYSFPMLGYMGIGAIVTILQRWMLQYYGGNYEQGIFAFANNFQILPVIFITALQPLTIREMSIAALADNKQHILSYFNKTYPVMFALAAYFSAFFFMEVSSIIKIFGGADYKDAALPLRFFLLSPLIYSMSSINDAVVLATKQTKLLLKLSLLSSPLGLLLTYIFLNPELLNFGATGLVIRTVGLEFFGFLLLLYIISKQVGYNFKKCCSHFLYALPFLGVSYVAHEISTIAANGLPFLVIFFLSGFLYTCSIGFILYFIPTIIGLPRSIIDPLFNRVIELIQARCKKPSA